MDDITSKNADGTANVNTFENVWAALLELRKTVEETSKTVANTTKTVEETSKTVANTTKTVEETSKTVEETSKTVEETSKTVANTTKTVEETSKEVAKTTKIVADLSKNVGGLGNLQGRLTEAMFGADLWKKFNEIGLPFNKQSSNYKFVENGRVFAQADFFLENGEYAMPVEIKTELSMGDIDQHIERVAKIREYMDARSDSRKLMGAIAGGIVAENAMNYAHKKGLYVLTQNGDSVAVAAVPQNFKRREW